MTNPSVLVAIEEYLNASNSPTRKTTPLRQASLLFSHFCSSHLVSSAMTPTISRVNSQVFRDIQAHLDQTAASATPPYSLYDEVVAYIERLNDSRYYTKKGDFKAAPFYTEAQIDAATWHDIKYNHVTPSKKTLWKLILALNLTFEEAEAMLAHNNASFDPSDIQDQVIEAIIAIRNQHSLKLSDIIAILYEYQEMYAETKPFTCIYDTPAMIQMNKEFQAQKNAK